MPECDNGTPAWIGPIAVRIGNHRPAWTGGPANGAIRTFRIDGSLLTPEGARQLQELVGNPHRRLTLGPVTGVLEPIWGDGGYADFNGWYVIAGADVTLGVGGDYEFGWGAFSMDATLIGIGELVVVRGARIRGDDFGLRPRSVLAQPFWARTPGWQVEPGGDQFTREYDPRTAYDPAAPADDGRELAVRLGDLT